MPRTRYEVKRSGGQRAVTQQGVAVVSQHRTKDEAVRAGSETARATGDSQLIIKGTNGRIQSERTYGNDPRPTRG